MKKILAVILVSISVSATADNFDSAKRVEARKDALQHAIAQRKKDQEDHDKQQQYMIEEYCPAKEDAYWAEKKAENLPGTDEQIRSDWAKSFSGAWCIQWGFKP